MMKPALLPAVMSPELKQDEISEAGMMGELVFRIIAAEDAGLSCPIEMHAIEAMTTETGKALKDALFLELGWRRAFFAMHEVDHLRK